MAGGRSEGRVTLVTGGARGIGAAIARHEAARRSRASIPRDRHAASRLAMTVGALSFMAGRPRAGAELAMTL